HTCINPTTLTFAKILADKRTRIPNKLFLHNLADGRKWTYGEFDEDTSRMASGFFRAGVAPGDHVAVMMENCPEQLLSYFALSKLGACTVPVNTGARGNLLVYFLTHADCSTDNVEQALLPRVLEIADTLPPMGRILVLSAAASADSQEIGRAGCRGRGKIWLV